jgi:hypothetical protein
MLESARESRAYGTKAFWDNAERLTSGTGISSLRADEAEVIPILHEQIPARSLQIISVTGIL